MNIKLLKLSFCAFICVLIISCKQENKTDEITKTDQIEEPILKEPKNYDENCFLYAVNKDSISISYTIIEDKVTGKMHYNFFEKDGSFGDFVGEFKGDTLIGTYDFESEGMQSNREVIFLKQNDQLINGSGKIIQRGNSETFEPNTKFSFNSFKMNKANCEDLNFDWEITSQN